MRSCSSTTRGAERLLLALGALLALAPLLLAAPARAAEYWYGLGAGAGTTLAPLDRAGGWVAGSAATDDTVAQGPLHVSGRGTFAAFFARDCWAVLPLLGGDTTASVGAARFFLTGGVQLFGFAHRDEWTFFLPFGLHGGAGLAFDVRDDLRLGARAQLAWIPGPLAARISAPEQGAAPTLLLLTFGLTVEWRNEVPEL